MQTRVAPTPSGYLHLGNAANALLTSWWARQEGLALRLRIDDVDAERARPEYVDDILDLMTWLGIEWTDGPRTLVETEHARGTRVTHAREMLQAALDNGLPAYACTCSRRDVTAIPTLGCPGRCRTAGHPLVPERSALRVHVPAGTCVSVQGVDVPLDVALGDFVIWRKDDQPAYQWFSVVEDTLHGTTHILRGEDLRTSTAAQRYLARFLPESAFLGAEIRHHPLLLDDSGAKLSKSQLNRSTGLPRTPSTRAEIRRTAMDLGRSVGITEP